MKALLPWIVLGALVCVDHSQAVENGATSSFNTTAPTSADIPNWTTGWTQPSGQTGITGWNYVGTVAGGGGGASGVYLGNNWVLTAGHVGPGTFTLGGIDYSVVPNSSQGITDANGTADITLFQISAAPNLPRLPIASSPPTPLSITQSGSKVAMLGYGGGVGETWGLNTVTQRNLSVQVGSFISTDFETVFGTSTAGIHSATNNYYLVLGDSGGGDFIFNSSTSKWELAGINEAVDVNNDSVMVQLSSYSTQINAVLDAPEPSTGALAIGGVLLLVGKSRRRKSC